MHAQPGDKGQSFYKRLCVRVPREGIPPEAPFTHDAGNISSNRLDNKKPKDENIVPASEHSRLTVRKSTDAAHAGTLPAHKCAYGRSKDEGE